MSNVAKRLRWEGLVCLITGASSGIGLATCIAFARRGATIIAVGRRRRRLEEVVKKLGGVPHSYVTCDVSDLASVRAMVQEARKLSPHIDILVNNAGVSSSGSLLEATSEQIEQVIKTNLLGQIWCTKELLPALKAAFRKTRTPLVINVASMAGRIPTPRAPDYAASKFGLVAFTEAIWEELASIHIRTMMVNPGFAHTEGFPMDHLLNDRRTAWAVMKPERVVAAMIRGIERGAFEVRVQWWMHPLYHLAVIGGPLRRVVSGALRRRIKGLGPPKSN